MSEYCNLIAIVEGKSEQVFVQALLAPYLGAKRIGIRPVLASKPGQNGGDIKFSRIQRDVGNFLKQNGTTYVTTFVDYYGTNREWPGFDDIAQGSTPEQIANTINEATVNELMNLFPSLDIKRRFIPYMSIHEFEALLFSDSEILASELGVNQDDIDSILNECGAPEAINNTPQTAPSKRLNQLSKGNMFPKMSMGISIAKKIGINKMRKRCPLFSDWLTKIENIND